MIQTERLSQSFSSEYNKKTTTHIFTQIQTYSTEYILVGGLKVTYSYQVLKNGLEDVTNDVRDCPGGGPCYVLVYVGLEAGLVTQSKDSLFCPQQKWTFHLFLHFDSADF